MSKALDIANDLTSFEDKYSSGTISGSDITTSNVTISGSNKIDFTSTHHTFTLKPIDETVGSDTQSGQFAVYNGATKLWGINESGWVQNPKGIAMCLHATAATNDYYTPTVNTALAYDLVYHALGDSASHWDSSTYTFTAPIDGMYCMGASWLSQNSKDDFELHWYVNGSRIKRHYNGQDNRVIAASTLIYMYAGDYFQFIAGSAITFYRASVAGDMYSNAFIYLIG
jgi:hypothetical protein